MRSHHQRILIVSLLSTLFFTVSGSVYSRSFKAVKKVGQWDRFEETLTNTKKYTDPYNEVLLEAVFTKPNGAKVRFWGFYDGGVTWKIRFMPDQLGLWRYEARFSDQSGEIKGSFQCIPSTIPGMIQRDETNPRWLGFKGGKHIFVRSLHIGPLFNLDPVRRKVFLDWAQKQGYNMLGVRGHQNGFPKLWPLNSETFQQVETVLNDLSDRRIIVWGFWGLIGRGSPDQAEERTRYLRYFMARIGPYWNEIFNVGGPEIDKRMSAEEIDKRGAEIKELDVFGHLLGVHQLSHDDYFREKPWVSLVTLQIKIPDLTNLNKTLIRNQPGSKPIFSSESCWAGNTIQFAKRGGCHMERLRHQLWVHFLSAATLSVADMKGNNATGFSDSMNLNEMIQERHDIPKMVWDFAQTTPFYRMNPHPELVDTGICLAERGRTYLVYLPSGGPVNVNVESGKRYKVQWINGRNPSQKKNGEITSDGRGLIAPDNQDWVLSLTAY
jgi:hypothetical protein